MDGSKNKIASKIWTKAKNKTSNHFFTGLQVENDHGKTTIIDNSAN